MNGSAARLPTGRQLQPKYQRTLKAAAHLEVTATGPRLQMETGRWQPEVKSTTQTQDCLLTLPQGSQGHPCGADSSPPAPRLHGRGAPILLNTNMFPLDFHSSRGSGLRGQSHRARDENGARKEGGAGRPPTLPPRSPLPLHHLRVKSTWPPTSQGWHADLVFTSAGWPGRRTRQSLRW